MENFEKKVRLKEIWNKPKHLSKWERFKAFIKKDPKGVFDHFRNIGIAATLALGAGALSEFKIAGNPYLLNDIAEFSYIFVLVVASVLFALNIMFAKKSWNQALFGKEKPTKFIEKLLSWIMSIIYSVMLFTLTIMFTFNAAKTSIESIKDKEGNQEKLILNIKKVNETLNRIIKENEKLSIENNRLKKEIILLSESIESINKTNDQF